MFHQSNTLRAEYRPYNKIYAVDTDDSDQNKYLQDYRLTLNEGYREYLATFEKWAQSLGLTFSAQPAYNLPLDMVSQTHVCICILLSNDSFREQASQSSAVQKPSLWHSRTSITYINL